jgi:hypothetical protein
MPRRRLARAAGIREYDGTRLQIQGAHLFDGEAPALSGTDAQMIGRGPSMAGEVQNVRVADSGVQIQQGSFDEIADQRRS